MPCLLVGTQIDIRNQDDKDGKDAGKGEKDGGDIADKLRQKGMRFLRQSDGDKAAKDLGAVQYVECSALSQQGLKEVFDTVRHHSKCLAPTITDRHPTGHCCCSGTSCHQAEEEEALRDPLDQRKGIILTTAPTLKRNSLTCQKHSRHSFQVAPSQSSLLNMPALQCVESGGPAKHGANFPHCIPLSSHPGVSILECAFCSFDHKFRKEVGSSYHTFYLAG